MIDQDVAGSAPALPLTFKERRVVVTPYPDRLRLCGTLELGTAHAQLDLERLAPIQAVGREALPGVRPERVIDRWAGLRPCTPDGMPVIGRSRAVRNIVVATGHGMWGVILAPVTARMVLDELQGVGHHEPLLSPDRFLGRMARRAAVSSPHVA